MNDRVAARWGDAAHTVALAGVSWMASPAVQIHLNERATGDPARDWLSGWAVHYLPGENLRVLVLGCGEGWLERALVRQPFVASIDACDLAADAVTRARDAAAGIGSIHYEVKDLNTAELPQAAYDAVIAHSILHHVERLEHALEQIDRALKPEGTLIVNEYCGPRRFQFGDDVLRMIDELLVCLPERLRRGQIEPRVYERKERPPESLMIEIDPSEAVRSDEILPLIAERFDVLDRRDLGGTILQHLLYDIVQNFRFDAPAERSMIELLCTIEAALVDGGAIPSDFAIVAARKRGARRRRYRRALPPRPAAAFDVDPDPLGVRGAPTSSSARRQRRRGRRRSTEQRLLPSHLLRALRIALVGLQERRANLIEERRLGAAFEQLRYALAPGVTPFAWVIGRFAARADPAQEDHRAIGALLEAFERLVNPVRLPPR